MQTKTLLLIAGAAAVAFLTSADALASGPTDPNEITRDVGNPPAPTRPPPKVVDKPRFDPPPRPTPTPRPVVLPDNGNTGENHSPDVGG